MVSMLKDEWYDLPDAARLIEFGSCSLHVVHGSLRPDKNQLVGMSLNIFVQRIISSKICLLGGGGGVYQNHRNWFIPCEIVLYTMGRK